MTKGYYIFVKSYKHPKTGKLMIASDYGKKLLDYGLANNK